MLKWYELLHEQLFILLQDAGGVEVTLSNTTGSLQGF
jgi:hypothetical protein